MEDGDQNRCGSGREQGPVSPSVEAEPHPQEPILVVSKTMTIQTSLRSRDKSWPKPLKVSAAVASIVIPVLLTWWLAPAQEVRSQKAVEQKERQDEQSKPLLDVVEAKYN